DLTTGAETRLTGSIKEESWPDISGDYIVWKDSRSGAEDIYLRRLSTGAEVALTLDSYSQKLPVISGTTIAWMDKRNGNWDIYTARDTVAPAISGIQPAPGSAINNTLPAIGAAYADSGEGIDIASIRLYFDDADVTSLANVNSAATLYTPAAKLDDGAHTVRLIVDDLAGNTSEQIWSFTVKSPVLTLTTTDTYWPSYTSYLERQLLVEFRLANPGSGLCKGGQVVASNASNGVLPLSDLPVNFGDLETATTVDYSILYLVPPTVSRFLINTTGKCLDDGSNVYIFAGPPQE
ncbi:MAG: hypothetical protein AAB281_00300, partial [Actinomycetota bacterium]